MLTRIFFGGLGGAGLGYVYHATMNYCGSQCLSQREPAVPIVAGIILGVFAVAMSKP